MDIELHIIPRGSGKYDILDGKERKIYYVTKKRKLIGNPITTLHDANGYALYTMIRTAAGMKPSFDIIFNDALLMKAQCTSLYVDPTITFEGKDIKYKLRGKKHSEFTLTKDREEIGKLVTEDQANGDPIYTLTVKDKAFDDFIPLFAVATDKSFSGKNK